MPPEPLSAAHQSPAKLAWRRLCANRLAMLGLIVVALVGLATLLTPWLAPHDPERAHHWIGPRAPGFVHPDCAGQNRFRVGVPAEAPARLLVARRLEMTVEERERSDYRIALRRGAVRSITRKEGSVEVSRLDLAAPEVSAVEMLDGGVEGAARGGAVLRVGEPPPAGWFASGVGVMELRVAAARPPVGYAIELADGVPTVLTRDGVAVEAVTLRGEDVRRVVADGRELTLHHLLGTDHAGRDLLSRVLWGGQVSLLVGLVATIVSLVIGVLFGAVAGYLGGRTDRAMMGAVDVLYAVPFMFLVILLLTLFERSLLLLFIALGAVQWLTMARIVRGQVLSLVNREFIAAARMSGASHARIIGRHLIPNCLGPVIVYATLTVPAVILQESFLSFLGLGVGFAGRQIDSWGALVNEGAKATQHPWLLLVPALWMSATLLALNALGDGLRDAFDPRGSDA